MAQSSLGRVAWPLRFIPLGHFFQPTAHRRPLTGMLQGPTLFWNLRLG